MTTLPTEKQQRAKWDLLLTDAELRLEQVRQIKTYEPRQIWISAITAAAAVFAAGGVVGGLLVRVVSGHGP